jgi:rhodanese-related sulfurtransferase
MIYIALAILAILSFYNLLALKSLRKKLEETKDSIHSQVSWAKEDLRGDITGMKTVMKVLAAGGRVSDDMVDEGKPYSDISAADAVKFLKENPETVIVDVRTSSEYQAGHIAGARLIPVDEIENRLNEVPKEAKHLLVTCQGGTRSAAACQFLSEKGYMNLMNMYDGMGSWPEKKEIGVMIHPPASHKTND